ncbi:MAG: hypothetical protein H7210_14215 [Pyrinomonadaceae bacterium]|nr:hypothetical protein [Phycisphaerales bacterium]
MRRFVSVLVGGIIGCAAATTHAQPCCPCDITRDNIVNSQDYFGYISAFFAEDAAADLDGSGIITSQDYFEFVACFFTGCPDSVDAGFRSSIPAIADCSYHGLFALGTDAFDILLGLTQEGGDYSGYAWRNPNSSIIPVELISIRQMSLHVFDAILLGRPAPHYSPVLITVEGGANPEALLSEAVSLYTAWWNQHRGLSLEMLRQLPGPLDKSDVRWHGPLSDTERELAEGTKVVGSDTPVDPRVASRAGNKPYKFIYAPARPRPYNCLAWAFGEDMLWMEPVPGRGGSLDDVLTDYGYNTTAVACAGACPNGRGPKVLFVYALKPRETANDDTWTHAMKQQADGKWTSKNGETEKWIDIVNHATFVDESPYKAARGQTLELKCYCK